MKRPWTPGPWTLRLEPIDVNWWDNVERMANITLASKTPEMAELLIELVDAVVGGYCGDDYSDYLKCQEKAEKLLKEIGYDPTVDADPAD